MIPQIVKEPKNGKMITAIILGRKISLKACKKIGIRVFKIEGLSLTLKVGLTLSELEMGLKLKNEGIC